MSAHHDLLSTVPVPTVGVVVHCTCGWHHLTSCHDAARKAYILHRHKAKELVQ